MAFLNPSVVVEKFDLRAGMKIADFGCGSGHFTIEMARLIGRDGVVYALDVQSEALEAVKSRAALARLSNIEIGRADLEAQNSTGLKDNLVDFVLVSNMLFQVENKEAVARECFRILKPGARAAVIDWLPGSFQERLGPPQSARIPKEQAVQLFEAAGLKKARDINVGESHYGLIFIKSPEH